MVLHSQAVHLLFVVLSPSMRVWRGPHQTPRGRDRPYYLYGPGQAWQRNTADGRCQMVFWATLLNAEGRFGVPRGCSCVLRACKKWLSVFLDVEV